MLANNVGSFLQVRWDDVEARHNRVSPWEIEPSGSLSSSSSLMAPGPKRTRIGLPSAKPDVPVPSRFSALQACNRLSFPSPSNIIDWSSCSSNRWD